MHKRPIKMFTRRYFFISNKKVTWRDNRHDSRHENTTRDILSAIQVDVDLFYELYLNMEVAQGGERRKSI